jgi:hypothetical protein
METGLAKQKNIVVVIAGGQERSRTMCEVVLSVVVHAKWTRKCLATTPRPPSSTLVASSAQDTASIANPLRKLSATSITAVVGETAQSVHRMSVTAVGGSTSSAARYAAYAAYALSD